MDLKIRDDFLSRWKKYFNKAELPITFYYTDEPKETESLKPALVHRCFIGDLAKVRKGKSLHFDVDSIGCAGGKRYLGYKTDITPNFEYFISCGIPGELEGERYKKTPELVKKIMKKAPKFSAPARYIVFKRWDMLQAEDNPEVVIFFAEPDVLSGLFTLAGFDEEESCAVITPFAAGCGSIVQYPYIEVKAKRPKGVIGMFDVSARPYVPEKTLTFSAPMEKFSRMIENMDESFLITSSWDKVKKRIK
jgi:uncharacterized protein (DUF169 family)